MKKNIVYVADFFYPELIGGAEIYGDVLISRLRSRNYDVITFKSQDLTPDVVRSYCKSSFFIISNYKLLNEQSKLVLMDECKYAILDHDPQFCKSNNPILYNNCVVPEDQLQNKDFYRKAYAVFCQSKLHAETIEKNLLLKNIINLGCNLWSADALSNLQENIGRTKTRKYGIMNSNNKNKGMPEAINYCKKNEIDYELISFCEPKLFIQELAKTETLIFLPTWMETFCRVAVEARVLGCKLITNKCIGCATEPFFSLKGQELLNAIIVKQDEIINIYEKVVNLEKMDYFFSIELPKVSIITTIYKAGEYIKGFMEAFKNQTINDAELIIIDANSPDNEKEIIDEYIKENNNIKYIRVDEKITTSKAFNMATEMAKNDFIACVLVDDRIARDYLEVLSKHLFLNPDVDLVFCDHFVTTKPNEEVDKNSSRGKLWEHSRNEFSRENMIKCLPSPTFMCRRTMWDRNNGFDEKLLHSCDWDFFLRCVDGGSIFKKINKTLGLYYFNPNGLSTSSDSEKMLRRHKEEKETFFKFKHIFPENFEKFKAYFESL